MSTLYELTSDWQNVYEMLDNPDIDEQAIFDTIEGIEATIEDKADGYAKIIKQLELDASGIKAEVDRLNKRAQSSTNRARLLKMRLQEAMETTGKVKFKTGLFSYNIQSNPPALVLSDVMAILQHEQYITPHVIGESDIDKAKLKADIQAGAKIKGAEITQGASLRIR